MLQPSKIQLYLFERKAKIEYHMHNNFCLISKFICNQKLLAENKNIIPHITNIFVKQRICST